MRLSTLTLKLADVTTLLNEGTNDSGNLSELEQYLIVSLMHDISAVTGDLVKFKKREAKDLKKFKTALDGLQKYLQANGAEASYIKSGKAQVKDYMDLKGPAIQSSFQTLMKFEKTLEKTSEGKKLLTVIEDADNLKGRTRFFSKFKNAIKGMGVRSTIISAYEQVNKHLLIEQQLMDSDI